MDEIRKEYYDDIKAKNMVARSARSSHTTPLKGNSKVETEPPEKACYTKLLKWEEIKALSPKLRKTYLERLMDYYGIGPSQLAKAVGRNRNTVWAECNRLGVEYKKYAGIAKEDAFLEAVKAQQEDKKGELLEIHQEPAPEPVLEQQEAEKDQKIEPEEKTPEMAMSSATLELCGHFNALQIARTLANVWPEGENVRITVKIEDVF